MFHVCGLILKCENLVLSNELIKVELPPWKIWNADISPSISPRRQSVAICSGESLMLEVSAFQVFHGGNSTFINSFDKTKFSCFTLPPMQHHSFIRNMKFQYWNGRSYCRLSKSKGAQNDWLYRTFTWIEGTYKLLAFSPNSLQPRKT